MPVIRTIHVYPPVPFRNFDWTAYLDNDEPDDSGNGAGPYGHGATEKEAHDNLIFQLFEDVESDHLLALVEALKFKAQEDWSNRSAEVVDAKTVAGIQIGYDRAMRELRRLLDLPTVQKVGA